MNSCFTVAFIWSPRQLLQSDTGVPHFALDPLTYRCLLSLSPAADFAEPRPPRHIPPPPDSGREALRPAAPPPHFWRGSRLQSSASPACGSPWIWRAVMPDTNGWSARWYPSCGGATARGRGPNRGWIPVPGDNSGGWGPPTGLPNTPSQWLLYIVSLLESFRLMYSTGRSSPPISWVRTAPSPRSDASVCSKKGRRKVRRV